MKETAEFFNILNRVSIATAKLPQRAATLAVNFSKDRFRAKNWIDYRTEVWPQRKRPERGKRRGLLIQSGRLRRSVRKVIVTNDYAIIGTDVPYAQAHNEGFRGTVTVPTHTRKRPKRGGTTTVQSHTKKLHIPKRRFLGESNVLTTQIQRMMTAEITRAIKLK
jgi:phage gpG-like protein